MGRTNWEKKFYVKLKADSDSIKLIKKIVEDMGDDFFVGNHTIRRSLSDYQVWKDQWIPVITKRFGLDIVCGHKAIHMIVYRFPSFASVNAILDRYCDWAHPNTK